MDVYGITTPDVFRIDDLLDFTNEDLIATDSTFIHHQQQQQHFTPSENPSNYHRSSSSSATAAVPSHSTDFTDELCVPSDDVAELEWLSQFVDDSFSDFPANDLTGTLTFRSDSSFTGRSRSKRSRAASTRKTWSSSPESEATTMIGKSKPMTTVKLNAKMISSETSSSSADINGVDWSSPTGEVRRCTHCASEKTPQWRTGPLGPKTLCNACGVRYKSGRLVPEYRPAASPTFVLTQHSNSHRKVMELRRQKEMHHHHHQLRPEEEQQQRQFYRHHHHHNHDFEVC